MADEQECFCIKCGLSDPESKMVALYEDNDPEAVAEVWAHNECLRDYRGATGMYQLKRFAMDAPQLLAEAARRRGLKKEG